MANITPGLFITMKETRNHFDVYVTVHRDKFLIIKQLNAPVSQIYFGMKLYMFRTEELSETCRVSFKNKFENFVHLVVLFYEK